MIDRIFKYYVTIALFSVIGLLIFITILILPENQTTKDKQNIESLYLQNNEINGLVNNGLSINDDIILYNSDGNIRDIKLSELSATLVFRFSAFSCNACVEYAIETIKKHFDNYEINPNVLIIVSDAKQNTMKKWKNILYLHNSNLGSASIIKFKLIQQ
jgi:hypothetical protein